MRQREALVGFLLLEGAALHADLIILLDRVEAALERFFVRSRRPSPECRHWRSSWRCRRPWCRRRSRRRASPRAASGPPACPGFSRPRVRRRRYSAAPSTARRTTSFANSSRSRFNPSSTGKLTAARTASIAASGASSPRDFLRHVRRRLVELVGVRAERRDFIVEIAHVLERPLFGDAPFSRRRRRP